MSLPVETYKKIRAEQTEAFKDPKQTHALLFWAMNQLRKTARTIDLLEVGAREEEKEGELTMASSIPDVTADVIENVLRAQGYKMKKTPKRKRHWFDAKET